MSASATAAERAGRPAGPAADRLELVDWLAIATVFSASFSKLYVEVPGKVPYSNVLAVAFVVIVGWRLWLRPRVGVPREVVMLAVVALALTAVYLAGWFNLDSPREARQFGKGLATWAIHGTFMLALALHVAERGRRMFELVVLTFVAGVAVNAVYGLAQFLALVVGTNLDEYVVRPLTFGHGKDSGAHHFGAGIYRINGLMRDVNHLGVTVGAAAAMGLAWTSMRGRARMLGSNLAALAFTLSRSGVLAFAAGAALVGWLRRRTLNAGAIASVAVVVLLGVYGFSLLMPELYQAIIGSRLNPQGSSAQTHLKLYSVVPLVLDQHPLTGLGFNTFAVEFAGIVGREGFGPHSYVIQVLTETGMAGLVITAVLIGLALRLAVGTGHAAAAAVAVGIVATLAGNLFYLTAHLILLKILLALAYAAPGVFAGPAASAPATKPTYRMPRHDDD